MNSAGTSSWEESEKENYYAPVAPKTELDALVNFLSKFDSKVAAIWGNEESEGANKDHQAVWGQPAAPEEEEDLLTSGKTHFKPIREREEPCFGFWSVEDPAEYATYQRTANSTFPLRFKVKSVNDKAVQTDADIGIDVDMNFSSVGGGIGTEGETNCFNWTTGFGHGLGITTGFQQFKHPHHQLQPKERVTATATMVSYMESD